MLTGTHLAPRLFLLGALLLGGLVPAAAQDALPPPWETEKKPPPPQPPPPDQEPPAGVPPGATAPPAQPAPLVRKGRIWDFSLGLLGASVGDGTAVERNATLVDDVNYRDIFDGGSGFNLEGRLHFQVIRMPAWTISAGPYCHFDTVTLEGDRYDDSNSSAYLQPDDLTIHKFLLGGHIRMHWRRFFMASQIGLGVASQEGVDAVSDDNAGGGIQQGELFDDTVSFALGTSFRLGWIWQIRGTSIGLSGFLSAGLMGAPGRGDQAFAVAFGDPDPEPLGTAAFGLALSVEFGGSRSPGP